MKYMTCPKWYSSLTGKSRLHYTVVFSPFFVWSEEMLHLMLFFTHVLFLLSYYLCQLISGTMYNLLIDPKGKIRERTFTGGEPLAKIIAKHLYLGSVIHNDFKYLLTAPFIFTVERTVEGG